MGETGYLLKYKTGRIRQAMTGAIEHALLRGENRQAKRKLGRRSDELEALFQIVNILAQPGNFVAKATKVVATLAEVVQADWVTLRQEDDQDHGLKLVAAAGPATIDSPPSPVLTIREAMAESAFRQGETVVNNDYAADPLASPRFLGMEIKSMASMPVKSVGCPIGVLNVGSRKLNHFTPQSVCLLAATRDGLGTLLQNERTCQQLRAKLDELAVLDGVARIMASNFDTGLGYQNIAAEVKKLVDFDRAVITIIDESKGTLSLAYVSQQTGGQISRGETVPLQGTLSGHVAHTRSTIVCGDITAYTYFQTIEHPLREGLRSVIGVPLVWREKIIGTVNFFSRVPNAYGLREQAILERLARQIAPVVEGARIFHETVT